MINTRMYALGSARSEIRELFEYGKKRKAEIGEDKVFDFSLGNPSVPCPEKVNDALVSLINNESPIRLHGYTSAQGDDGARAAIAQYLSATHGTEVSKDLIYLTVGAAAALCCALCAVVSPGEEVIRLAPFFPEYKVFVERCGATVKVVKCKSGDFSLDVDAIGEAISENTAAIIVNSPNNPTGAVYSEESIKDLSDLLRRKSKENGKDVYLIADEPYRELVYGEVTVPFIPKYYENTLVCYSFSKSLSLPGERIGYCMVSSTANESDKIYAAICGAGRSLGYVCAPSLLQKAIPSCLGLTSDIGIYERNRDLFLTKLTELGFEVVRPDGAFYLFVKAPTGDARSFSEMAKRHELLLVASDSFGYGGYVRISYCVSTELIERSLGAFASLAKEAGIYNGK